ncbi:hypothetical protein Y032_0010g1073 [Ancylostoma ceylanicum]|uniref:SCP domain-containing protein n=1 Tax=Ancylostoma ceylanicum TaxID=53326 RepID=A0A016VF82_9BILA|nr:hypothetical protein Y032_0010g1073 [Ancylostoma ceylanicum]
MANDENTRIGCASELRAPMYHLVCVYILFLCVCRLLASDGPKCKNTEVVPPEIRQQILDFHAQLGRPLKWSCKLEKQADSAVDLDKGEVDMSKLNERSSDYAALSRGQVKVNVAAALYYWSEKTDRQPYANMMNEKNERIGCVHKIDIPIYHFVCIYVSNSFCGALLAFAEDR